MRLRQAPQRLLLGLGLAILLPSSVLAVGAAATRDAARAVVAGGTLLVEGVPDVVSGERIDLELRRFDLFSPEARVVVHGADGDRTLPPPATLFFRGRLAGRAESRALLIVHEDGELRGVVADGPEVRMLGQDSERARSGGGLEARRVDAIDLGTRKPFRCALAELGAAGRVFPEADPDAEGDSVVPETPGYTAVYAVETDFEFYSIFNNSVDATNYITDLMAFVSMLYDDEINTTVRLGTINLRTTAADPWTQSSPLCSLFEYGRYWNNNYGAISRTAAVMLSGKSNGGGVAWIGVLCSGAFNYDHGGACPALSPQSSNYGGAYAYVGDIDGNFDLWDPHVLWDIEATAHEIGHNFNSPHSHCYAGLGGNANQIDFCYTSECVSATANCGSDTCVGSGSSAHWQSTNCACPFGSSALPGVGSTTGGSAGQGGGTIMSYCHLLSGGFGNTALDFGTGHVYGIAASREAARMASYVVATAPPVGCLDYMTGAPVFIDGFETGNTNRWGTDQP